MSDLQIIISPTRGVKMYQGDDGGWRGHAFTEYQHYFDDLPHHEADDAKECVLDMVQAHTNELFRKIVGLMMGGRII